MPISLGELATRFCCELIGDPDTVVHSVAPLQSATPGALTFLSNPAFAEQLLSTAATAVIVREQDAANCPVAALISDNPYATYARMANAMFPPPPIEPGVHASAVVDSSAQVSSTAQVAALAVIGANSRIGDHVYIGPGTVVGPDCDIGAATRILANVSIVRQVRTGERCLIHPGAVIGGDGFGNAATPDGWVKVPQLGGVQIGNDVELGSNTTVDCGAIGDTILRDGVRIDNLCMIAHNVDIGEHSAIAGLAGIAGSSTLGKRCMMAGGSGIIGHITVCDDVIIHALALVTKDIDKPGQYASTFPAAEASVWAKQMARFRRIGNLVARVKKLEK